MKIRDIMHALTRRYSPFKFDVAYNTTGVLPWEADMVAFSRSGYITEIEIKTSYSDFKADFTGKPDKHEVLVRGIAARELIDDGGRPNTDKEFNWDSYEMRRNWDKCKPHAVRYFLYAIPIELQEKIEPLIPSYAGLIVVEMLPRYGSYFSRVIKKAPALKQSRKATDKERLAIFKSMYYRAWKRFEQDMQNQQALDLAEVTEKECAKA